MLLLVRFVREEMYVGSSMEVLFYELGIMTVMRTKVTFSSLLAELVVV